MINISLFFIHSASIYAEKHLTWGNIVFHNFREHYAHILSLFLKKKTLEIVNDKQFLR